MAEQTERRLHTEWLTAPWCALSWPHKYTGHLHEAAPQCASRQKSTIVLTDPQKWPQSLDTQPLPNAWARRRGGSKAGNSLRASERGNEWRCPCDSGMLTQMVLLRYLNFTTDSLQNHLNSSVERNTVKQSWKNEKTDTPHYKRRTLWTPCLLLSVLRNCGPLSISKAQMLKWKP